jgi:hypothetical protein
MATRKPEESTEQAAVRPRQYAAGTGWDVGQSAPSDAYRSLDDASAPVGPVVYDHPGGRAVQIVVAGGLITEGVARALTAADAPSDEEA